MDFKVQLGSENFEQIKLFKREAVVRFPLSNIVLETNPQNLQLTHI